MRISRFLEIRSCTSRNHRVNLNGTEWLQFLLGLTMSSALIASQTHAEIILHGTRVIYPSDAREVTLQVSNNGSKPSLVQAWIDEGDAKSTPDQSKVPFMITPLFRVLIQRRANLFVLLHYQMQLN